MFIVLISWLIILFLSVSYGTALLKYLHLDVKKYGLYLIPFGLFFNMLLLYIMQFFNALHANSYSLWIYTFTLSDVVLLGLGLIFYFLNKKEMHAYIRQVKSEIMNLTKYQYAGLLGMFFIVLILSSLSAHLPDNESYYIQTIKWADQVGFVPGLMNLHPFLGQFSSWHILQAGMNFAPHYNNDLNGFFLLYFVFFSLQKKGLWTYAPMVFPVLLYFVSSPSPDLPVIILSLIFFALFLANYDKAKPQGVYILLILSLFAVMIKLTALPLLLLLFIIIWRNGDKILVYKFLSASVLVAILLLAKNYIVTGYVFYPFDFLGQSIQPEWQFPHQILAYLQEFGRSQTPLYALLQGKIDMKSAVKLMLWLVYFISILAIGVKAFKGKLGSEFKAIFAVQLFYGVFAFVYMGEIRFALHFFVLNMIILLYFGSIKFVKPFIINILSGILIFIFLVYRWQQTPLSGKQVIKPYPVSKYATWFEKGKQTNFDYYYPVSKQLFWETGDAPLPAVQPEMLLFMKENFHFQVELRGDKLEQGFIPKKNIPIYFSVKQTELNNSNKP